MPTTTPEKINDEPLICVPGQRLCLSGETTVAGPGTYERQGYIYSMLSGILNIRQKDDHVKSNACNC